MHHPTHRKAYTSVFFISVVEYRLEREIAQWVHRERTPSHGATMGRRIDPSWRTH